MLNAKNTYNIKYQKENYFGYKQWLYSAYVSSLVAISGLQNGYTVLDVGCGQGFFSCRFHKCGMKVLGIDISLVGIGAAQKAYDSYGIQFIVGDVRDNPFSSKFDCVFTRSFSLYNVKDFSAKHDVTDILLEYVKKGGTLIFSYYTKLKPSKRCDSWLYHTLSDVKQHFSRYPNAKVFFISRLDTLFLRQYAFNPLLTNLNILLSRVLGFGGDLICIIKKE